MDELIYLGFAILKLTKLLLYETYFDKLQPAFGQKETFKNNIWILIASC